MAYREIRALPTATRTLGTLRRLAQEEDARTWLDVELTGQPPPWLQESPPAMEDRRRMPSRRHADRHPAVLALRAQFNAQLLYARRFAVRAAVQGHARPEGDMASFRFRRFEVLPGLYIPDPWAAARCRLAALMPPWAVPEGGFRVEGVARVRVPDTAWKRNAHGDWYPVLARAARYVKALRTAEGEGVGTDALLLCRLECALRACRAVGGALLARVVRRSVAFSPWARVVRDCVAEYQAVLDNALIRARDEYTARMPPVPAEVLAALEAANDTMQRFADLEARCLVLVSYDADMAHWRGEAEDARARLVARLASGEFKWPGAAEQDEYGHRIPKAAYDLLFATTDAASVPLAKICPLLVDLPPQALPSPLLSSSSSAPPGGTA